MGRRQRIDRDQIVGAALRVADEGGIAAVTMQRVAGELGVTPMALYRHVGNREGLLDGIVERLLLEIGDETGDEAGDGVPAGWDEQLIGLLARVRAVALGHPSSFLLVLTRPAATPAAAGVRDRIYASLTAAGISGGDLVAVERIVSTLALGFATGEASGRFGPTGADLDAQYALLARFVLAGLAHLGEGPGPASGQGSGLR